MNVTFHVLTGFGIAAVLGRRESPVPGIATAAGLATAVAIHGVLDYVPHSYPLNARVDVILGVALLGGAVFLAKPHVRLLLAMCFLGSILPDLIDLGPGILNRDLGLSLPEVEWFPWHWKQHSGSIYDGSRATESAAYHLLAMAGCNDPAVAIS